MAEEIIVNIGPDGEIGIDAQGFKGKGCTEATEFLEKGLGRVSETTKKAEYRQSGETVVNRQYTGR
jgi:hypothetical protein